MRRDLELLDDGRHGFPVRVGPLGAPGHWDQGGECLINRDRYMVRSCGRERPFPALDPW